jgi:hypothetical protein
MKASFTIALRVDQHIDPQGKIVRNRSDRMDATTQIAAPTAEVFKFLIRNLYSEKLRGLFERQKCGLKNRQVGIFFLIDQQFRFGGGGG